MKISIKNRISVAAVLAVMLLFTACAKPAQIKRKEALANISEAMMGKEYFTVTVTGKYFNEVSENAYDYTAVVNLLKTAEGYDYRAEVTTKGDEEVTKRATVKVGDDMYTSTADGSGKFTEWNKLSHEEREENSSVISGLGGDTLKSIIGDIESGDEMLTEKNGRYEISAHSDYAEMINSLKGFVVKGEGVQAGEFVAKSLNEKYTREMLVEDINRAFKDGVKLVAMINVINDYLEFIGSKKTVKDVFNAACKKLNITSDDIYRVLAPMVTSVKLKPPGDKPPYEYIMSTGVGTIVTVDTLLSKVGINLTTEQIRVKLLAFLDDDDVTFGDLYESVAKKFDSYLTRALIFIGADEDALSELNKKGALFGTENLKSYTVGKTELTRKTAISSKDFSIVSLDVNLAADIAYGEEQTLLVKTEITAHAKFDYKTKVNIVAPM